METMASPDSQNRKEDKDENSRESLVGIAILANLWQIMPGWAVSALVHLAGIFVLAALTLPMPFEPKGIFAVTASNTTPEETFGVEISSDAGSPGEAMVPQESSLTMQAAEVFSTDAFLMEKDLSLFASSQSISPLDALRKATEGGGGESKGLGVGMTSVFGVRTKGQRFVYVADNSNSMSKGRLEAVIQEIQDSVGMLKADQSFYVIFYSDTAYPLFHPTSAKTYVAATPENKERLGQWLQTVEHCLHTRGEEAMALAMKLKPDVIYLMGDGAFTDKTVEQTLEREDARVLIHTFGFDMKNGRDKEGFDAIAKQFRGEFHDASVAPEFLAMEKRNKRPHNQNHHSAWGITLPFTSKK
jgi:von Willebrand factor type A domain